MKVSYRKIKEFLNVSVSPEDAAAVLTATGLEIEGVESVDDVPGGLRGLVVGRINECVQHPNADKLRCCKVEIADGEILDIVCGAPNAAEGLHVLVATVGTMLYPGSGEPFKIKKGKIRGEVSMGMLCGADEVGLGEGTGGIMELDTKWAPGTLASEVFQVGTDSVLEIGLTPNRNDAMGHYGVARDLRAGLIHGTVANTVVEGLEKVELPSSPSINLDEGFSNGFSVNIINEDLAPKYVAVAIDGVKVGPSPEHAQRFLKAIGVAPINNVVDATNYVLHELGTPLHAFDYDTFNGNQINVRLANQDEALTTLDGIERKLDAKDLVIADENEAMCIAGVLGSEKHGVSESTTRVILESAFFNPVSVRKSAKRHTISTDASFRFERHVDPNLVEAAAQRAAQLITEWAGGEVTGASNFGSGTTQGAQIDLSWNTLYTLIGTELDRDRVHSILKSLDIEVTSQTDDSLSLSIPAYRSDVTRPADVVEEILRIHGFDQVPIPTRISSTLEIQSGTDREDVIFGWSSTLVARGFNEIMSNSLTKASYIENCNDADINPKLSVEILNPLSNDLGVMRQSLVFGGLEAIARNKNYKMPNLRLFELGRTYQKADQGYKETEHLSIWVTGRKHNENWNEGAENVDLFDLKQAVWAILTQSGVLHRTTERADAGGILLEGNEILLGENVIGRFGQVHPDLCEMCDVDQKVYWADLLTKPLLKKKKKIIATELPKFPSVRRDLSLILDKSTKFEEIKKAAFNSERKLLKEVNLFDVYEGDKLDKNQVSYAISLVLQDKAQTLTDKKIDKSVSRILDGITKDTGAVLRQE